MAKKIKENKIDKAIKKYWKTALMIACSIAVILLLVHYLPDYFGKVRYEGMTFIKEKYGNIIFYHYSYYLKSPTGQVYQNNIYFRNNPAKNDVPVVGGNIVFLKDKQVYIGINKTLEKCNQSVLGIAEISKFIANNFIEAIGGLVDKNDSINANMTYVSCSQYPKNMVIIMETGDKTEIVRQNNCYIIRANNCEILKASEKFVLQSLIDAREAMVEDAKKAGILKN